MALPILTASSLGDVGQASLPELNRLRLTEIATDLTDFHVMSGLLKKGNTITAQGKSVQWDVMVNGATTAANVGLGYSDNTTIEDFLTQATANWCNSKVDWAMIGQEEEFNGGDAKIVDLELVREKAAMIGMVQLMEYNWFGPVVQFGDSLTPYGMKTWITRPSSYSSDGFTGGVPTSSYTTIGLNPTTYPRWKSYYGQYTNVTDDDFVRRLKKALVLTDFKPPVEGIPTLNTGKERMLFSVYGLIGPLEELLKASNENIGVDLTKYMNSLVIQRTPIVRVPAMEVDTTNPIYGVPMGDLKLYRLKNWWMKRTELDRVPGQHTVKARYLDSTYQFVMTNRRTSFCLATSVTDPS